MAAALLGAAGQRVDVIALVRGGGARTDLATFDHELVARTIASLDVPVLTGIGHEIDTSVADVVAHTAHKTPTACATAVVELALTAAARVELAWRDVAAVAERLTAVEADRLTARSARATRGVRARLRVRTTARRRVGRIRGRAPTPSSGRAARSSAAPAGPGSTRAHLRVHDRSLEVLAGARARWPPRPCAGPRSACDDWHPPVRARSGPGAGPRLVDHPHHDR